MVSQSVRFRASQGRENLNHAGRSVKTEKETYRQVSLHHKKRGTNNNKQNNRQACERCTGKTHTTKKCKNCLRVGHFHNECKADRETI